MNRNERGSLLPPRMCTWEHLCDSWDSGTHWIFWLWSVLRVKKHQEAPAPNSAARHPAAQHWPPPPFFAGPTSWWGSTRLPGALLYHQSPNRPCYPEQKGMKFHRHLHLSPRRNPSKKIIKTKKAQETGMPPSTKQPDPRLHSLQ